MRVTVKEVVAAWVDHDRRAPYHTDMKPIGVDRKSVEGPFPTNESFENSWLPTEQATCEQVTVEQIEVVQVEVVTAEAEAIPGVPMSMFKAWEAAHDSLLDFQTDYAVASLDSAVNHIYAFALSLQRVGLTIDKVQLGQLKNFLQTNRPDRMDTYSPARAQNIAHKLDSALNRMHSEAARMTGKPKIEWYDYQADQMQRGPLSEQELRNRRGPGAGYLEDLWRRKRKHEVSGRRTANFAGVSPRMFKAWEAAHDAKAAVRSGGTLADVDRLAQALAQFVQEAAAAGSNRAKQMLPRVQSFVQSHPPQNGQEYTPQEAENYLDDLDYILAQVHQDVLVMTGTERDDWYAQKQQRSMDDHSKGYELTPEEMAEMQQAGMPFRMTPEQVRDKRGPGAPFLEEMWERTRNRERRGEVMRPITAADVIPMDPNKRRPKVQERGPMTLFDEGTQMPSMDLPLQGDPKDDYEAVLFMYDNVTAGMEDIVKSMITIQPRLDPQQQKEAGRLIANMRAALRALSARSGPVR